MNYLADHIMVWVLKSRQMLPLSSGGWNWIEIKQRELDKMIPYTIAIKGQIRRMWRIAINSEPFLTKGQCEHFVSLTYTSMFEWHWWSHKTNFPLNLQKSTKVCWPLLFYLNRESTKPHCAWTFNLWNNRVINACFESLISAETING